MKGRGRADGFILLLLIILLFEGCYTLRSSEGGGQVDEISARSINTSDIALPPGYSIEVAADSLTFPTGITFDDNGTPYITESGYSYGEEWTKPKLLRLDQPGQTTQVLTGDKNGPWNGVSYYENHFYIAEGGHLKGGRILQVTAEGKTKVLAENLPSLGDHHTNGPAVHQGYVYFGQGTATNSGVVGNDNANFGWLKRNPDFHDTPCEDITLRGQNFEARNALNDKSDEKTITGAFVPYNTATKDGEVIKGEVPCNGAVMRIPIEGGKPELVAWGFRNPFGLAFSPDGQLYVTDNGYDDRGSRPVWGTGDLLWKVEEGNWYGWPDFSGHHALEEENKFRPPDKNPVKPLLKNYPDDPPDPAAVLSVHSSSNGFDFSSDSSFGYINKAFIAQFGDMSPNVGKVTSPVGFKVVAVDPSNGVIEDFAVNKGDRNGPASWLEHGGLERPVDVAFNPTDKSLYIVDFGIMQMTKEGPRPLKNTGAVFKVTREGK